MLNTLSKHDLYDLGNALIGRGNIYKLFLLGCVKGYENAFSDVKEISQSLALPQVMTVALYDAEALTDYATRTDPEYGEEPMCDCHGIMIHTINDYYSHWEEFGMNDPAVPAPLSIDTVYDACKKLFALLQYHTINMPLDDIAAMVAFSNGAPFELPDMDTQKLLFSISMTIVMLCQYIEELSMRLIGSDTKRAAWVSPASKIFNKDFGERLIDAIAEKTIEAANYEYKVPNAMELVDFDAYRNWLISDNIDYLSQSTMYIPALMFSIHIADLLTNILEKDFHEFSKLGGVVDFNWLIEANGFIQASEEMAKASYEAMEKWREKETDFEDAPEFHINSMLRSVTRMAKLAVNNYCERCGIPPIYYNIRTKTVGGTIPHTIQSAIKTFGLTNVLSDGYLYACAADWVSLSTQYHIDTMDGPDGIHKYITPDNPQSTTQDMTFLTGFTILSMLILSELAFADEKFPAVSNINDYLFVRHLSDPPAHLSAIMSNLAVFALDTELWMDVDDSFPQRCFVNNGNLYYDSHGRGLYWDGFSDINYVIRNYSKVGEEMFRRSIERTRKMAGMSQEELIEAAGISMDEFQDALCNREAPEEVVFAIKVALLEKIGKRI